jgi:hypothetical protein
MIDFNPTKDHESEDDNQEREENIMYVRRTAIVVLILLGLVLAWQAQAAIPLTINHQGLVKAGGTPFSGNGDFRFAFVAASTGVNLWTNDGTKLGIVGTPDAAVNLPVVNGIYNVRLGDTTLAYMVAIPSSLFDTASISLRIWFNDGTHGNQQLTPDQPVSSGAYAFHALTADSANNADTVDNLHVADINAQTADALAAHDADSAAHPTLTASVNSLTTSWNNSVGFGGTGADGALAISSGTTVIDAANAKYVLKNYSSISITGTAKLAFINPHPTGTFICLKSKGDVVLTSSTSPMIDASGMGAAGAPGIPYNSNDFRGGTGSDGLGIGLIKTKGGTNDGDNGSLGGAVGELSLGSQLQSSRTVLAEYADNFVGGGGGSGGCSCSSSTSFGTTGKGGNGGGALVIECAGAWSFTTTGGISVAGAVGVAPIPVGGGGVYYVGGGGGGGGGYCAVLYSSVQNNSGTVTVDGGLGGAPLFSGQSPGRGGGGGGSGFNVGGSTPDSGTGATGAAGYSFVGPKTSF